jgi:hypothetical protein
MAKKISDEELEKLKASHPRGVKVLLAGPADADDADCDDFVFGAVTRAVWVQYRGNVKASLAGRGPADAATILAKNLLLYPTAAEFDALREKAPAITEEFGEILAADADAGMSVREGKR